jgi:hypothetical protein
MNLAAEGKTASSQNQQCDDSTAKELIFEVAHKGFFILRPQNTLSRRKWQKALTSAKI